MTGDHVLARSEGSSNLASFSRGRRSWLYGSASAIFAVLVLVAFWRTYYLSAWYGSADLSRLVRVHGAVMTGWVALLCVQSGLVVAHKVEWHRRLGVFGAAWAVLVVVLGSVTTLQASAREVAGHTDLRHLQLMITGLELVQMLLFTGFVTAAVAMRRRPDHHKRLMALTIVCMLPSVFPRLPIDVFQSNLAILLAVYAVLALLLFADTWRERRPHPAFIVGGGLVVLSLQVAYLVVDTPLWQDLLTTIVS